jgi:NTE family protein
MKLKLLFLLFILSLGISSQQKQPKVGLVLSGGGAKGFAHVRVLKEIEKAGVQLDYIGGTSMGAIVGGLFAAGYTATQLEEIIINVDFLELLQDVNSREFNPFFEKENGEKYFFTLPVSKGKVELPKGLSKGQNMLNLLTELLAPVDSISDFSKLSIPFFCIGTDVETGKQVLLEKGNLPLSLRASGSFPTLLNPIEIEGRLLIDGGVANNFPADVMKKKGMDIIIGVDVEGKLLKKEQLTSITSILNQIVSYKMYERSSDNKKIVDVYIKPDTDNYTVIDFGKSKEILEKGNEAAKKFTAVFQKIAAKQAVKKRIATIKISNTKFLIDKIVIEGLEKYTRAYVLGKLKIQEGDMLSNAEIRAKINSLAATKNYELIEHALKKKRITNEFHLKLKESSQEASLKLGIHYDLLYKSGVLINYNHKNLVFKNDLFSLDFVLGDNLRYHLNYFVDNGFYTSFGFTSSYNQFKSNKGRYSLFPGILDFIGGNFDVDYADFNNKIFLQTSFNRKYVIGIGAEHRRLQIASSFFSNSVTEETDPNSISDEILTNAKGTLEDDNLINILGYLKLDTYNKKYFPTKGFFVDLSFRWFIWSNGYNFYNNFNSEIVDYKPFTELKGKLGFATAITKKITFQTTNEAGFFTNRQDEFYSSQFILGGYNQNYSQNFIPFYGYEFFSLVNSSFLKSDFQVRYEFMENNYAVFIANYARVDENIFKDFDLLKDIKSGYAVGYSYDSFVGPIELKYSWTPDQKEGFWLFNLGFWF